MDKNKLAEEYGFKKYPKVMTEIKNTTLGTMLQDIDCSRREFAKESFLAGFDAAESIANAKIQELEQKLKNCISIDAHLEWKREWEQQLKAAENVIARLSECHLPKKPCAGVDLPQVMLEENCAIAKEYLKSRGE